MRPGLLWLRFTILINDMKRFCSVLMAFAVLVIANGLHATTVIPPTFDQLVRDADFVFEGKVASTRSQWEGEGAERNIFTYVTFNIEDALKGAPGATFTIRMLGGTVGDESAAVADGPRFKTGDHDVLFVEHNGTQFIPLVGIMHGRFRVEKDQSDRDVVAKDNGLLLSNVAMLGIDEKGAVSGPSLSLADFKTAIRRKLAELSATK